MLVTINEGSSILLTWLINFIKWNAGVTKYKFEHKTSQMMAIEGDPTHQENPIFDEKLSRSSTGDELSEENYKMTNVHRARPKKKTVSTSVEVRPQKEKSSPVGNFVPSKQMVFDVDKVLAPHGA